MYSSAPSQQHPRTARRHSGARAASFLLGIVAGLVTAAIVLLRTGSATLAFGAAFVVLAAGLVGAFGRRTERAPIIAMSMLLITVLGGWWLTDTALGLYRAFTFTAGPAEPADPDALAAADAKIRAFDTDGAFRLELDEAEIEAVIQNGLSDAESPLRRVTVDIVDGDPNGVLAFVGEFKNDDLTVEGSVTARLEAGAVAVEIVDLDLGSLTLPGIAEGAIEDLVESIADLNAALATHRVDVQAVEVGDDRIVIVGAQAGGTPITSAALLADLREQAAAAGAGVTPPPERLGPGVVDGTSAPGATYYVALGDSLAANVGVARARDGYVSRLHNQLQIKDGRAYGLRNFGVSGETSGTLIRSGQLDAALAFIRANPVTYVTIDIGANDLLGHLGSTDCSTSVTTPTCTTRLADTFAAYRSNMPVVFGRLRDAAPQATIVFMRAYNPFAFGFDGVAFERDSTRILDEFNDIAAAAAADFDILVADAFTPMLGTTGATTHMFDDPPDIHPVAVGYDILAQAILATLGG